MYDPQKKTKIPNLGVGIQEELTLKKATSKMGDGRHKCDSQHKECIQWVNKQRNTSIKTSRGDFRGNIIELAYKKSENKTKTEMLAYVLENLIYVKNSFST